MTNQKAKRVLTEMIGRPVQIDSFESVNEMSSLIMESPEHGEMILDGAFSVTELEAVVAYMKDPKGVCES